MTQLPALASIAAGAPLLPLYPKTFEEVYRFSTTAYKAGMIPRQNKRQKIDGDWQTIEEEAETVLARGVMMLMQGMEVGLPPMQALQLMAIINGRICIHSEGVPGILLAKGCKLRRWYSGTGIAAGGKTLPVAKEPHDDWTHHTLITRPDGEEHEGTFSVWDAKRAKLWSPAEMVKRRFGNELKDVENDSPWRRYWPRMLTARSLGFAAKDGAADILRGIAVREEIEDFVRMRDAIDVTPPKAENPIVHVRSSGPAFDPADIPDEPAKATPAPAEKAEPSPAVEIAMAVGEAAQERKAAEPSPTNANAVLARKIETELRETPSRAEAIRLEYFEVIKSLDAETRQSVIDMIDATLAGQIG